MDSVKDAEVFYKKHKGHTARVVDFDNDRKYHKNKYNGIIGEITGIEYNCISIITPEKHRYIFLPKYLRVIDPPIYYPDDCDNCGAKGKQKCKKDCPNKENT